MGDASDIEELFPLAMRDVARQKRNKLLWALGTMAFTALSTTVGVSWTLRGYVDDMRHENDKLRGDILVLAKKVEDLEDQQREVSSIRETANKALFLAQLAHTGKQ